RFSRLFLEFLLQLGGVESEDRAAGGDFGSFRRHHRDLEIPHVVELRRTEAARIERRQSAGDIDTRDEIPALDSDPIALTVGSQLVARPSGGDKQDDDRERNRDLALHRRSPSLRPLTTTHSNALQSPSFTSRFARPAAPRGASRTFTAAARRIVTRAERPGPMRAGSRRSRLIVTRNDRRSDQPIAVIF